MAKRSSAKRQTSKALAQTRKRRRRLITSWRMVRYGISNFSRNAWLTIAATAVMTITLLIVFTTVVARDVLANTVQSIQDRVEMTVYLKSDADEAAVKQSADDIAGLESVKTTTVFSPEQGRAEHVDKVKSDPIALKALNNSDPKFPWKIRVQMVDINDITELKQFVDTDPALKSIISQRTSEKPSYSGENRRAIEQIGGWAKFADRAGIVAGSVFVVISALIIFNTIRMAIFNRQEEIQMMKLIGAERSFIRGPFLVEAAVYGFIAAIIATAIGISGVYYSQNVLEEKGIQIADTVSWLITYSPLVLGVMIAIGAVIGIVSSLFATRRYLRL